MRWAETPRPFTQCSHQLAKGVCVRLCLPRSVTDGNTVSGKVLASVAPPTTSSSSTPRTVRLYDDDGDGVTTYLTISLVSFDVGAIAKYQPSLYDSSFIVWPVVRCWMKDSSESAISELPQSDYRPETFVHTWNLMCNGDVQDVGFIWTIRSPA